MKHAWLGKREDIDWKLVEKMYLEGCTYLEVKEATGLNYDHYYWWKCRFGRKVKCERGE